MRVNPHYRELAESYLFSTISRKVKEYQDAHPDAAVIRLGIGDVTRPLAPAVVEAMERAAAEQGEAATFRGYGPEQGYPFLREAVAAYYAGFGVELSPEEVFISDGAKSDLGNILDLFAADNTVLIPDPVYPVYVDTNRMAGRPILFADATWENGFLPAPDPAVKADIIYICSPNNPTGAVYTREGLQAWVDYALAQDAVILFDAAYACFIQDPALPRSIYEIPGARDCAIEFGSFSKMAGFTGTRCGFTIVPQGLTREGMSLAGMWLRRQTTKFNGVPYIVQRGAEAVFTPQGLTQIQENLAYYRENARVIMAGLTQAGIAFTGGEHSPYLWLRCPGGLDSWSYFDRLLQEAQVVGTPGAGFGRNGEGYFRLTAFCDQDATRQAMARLAALRF